MKSVTKKRVSSAARELCRIGLSVAVITVCAWVSIPIGAISFTLQTLAVALVGAVLGWRRGCAAVLVYLFMGLIGIPVFSGFKGGVSALFGPTGGYLFGFFFSALLPALAKLLPARNRILRMGSFYLAMILGVAVCYFFGTVWFVYLTKCEVGYAISLCVLPFIIPDLVKLFVAAFLAERLEKTVK